MAERSLNLFGVGPWEGFGLITPAEITLHDDKEKTKGPPTSVKTRCEDECKPLSGSRCLIHAIFFGFLLTHRKVLLTFPL
nr:MAG: hypothetical protein H3Bulk404599_000001 [Mitovirus sp.]QDH89369.1 MAG: hypothetical protein H3RhizoLitter15230_000002 [Mitovirus sp.]QDH90016.1 MAG: hypothetical protein H4RhizoLitter20221_000004 [Mitovirus sp.]QDH91428.1 MAG: hypothetical protein H2Bulk34192_000001 [Mitovirus sp.]